MRRPGSEIDNFNYNEVRFKEPIDIDLFRKQHDNLAKIYTEHGVKV